MTTKVVQVVTRLDSSTGGAQVHVTALVKYLMKTGVVCEIWGGEEPTLAFRNTGAKVRRICSLVRRLSPLRDIAALIELIENIREEEPTLMVLHSSKAGFLGRVAAKVTDTPCIFTVHGWSFAAGVPQPMRFFSWLLEFCIGTLGTPVIAVSDHDRLLARRLAVGNSDNVFTIHNGVEDTSSLFWAKPEDSNVIVMVARHCVQKDHDSLLRALVGVDADFMLRLVGDGPGLESTSNSVAALGLTDRVEIMGARSDIPELLSRAGLMVLSSHWEGLPLSIIEGMRAGLPVIASDVGGNSELIEDGVTGYLVPRGDVELLRSAILRILADPDLRRRMGRNARARYEKYFRAERCLERTRELILGLSESTCDSRII